MIGDFKMKEAHVMLGDVYNQYTAMNGQSQREKKKRHGIDNSPSVTCCVPALQAEQVIYPPEPRKSSARNPRERVKAFYLSDHY